MTLFLKTTIIAFLFGAVVSGQAQKRSKQERVKPVRAITGFLCASGESLQPRPEPFIRGGDITSKAIVLPQPDYPAKAKAASIYGKVEAEVVINSDGTVMWVRLRSGHPLLREEVKRVVCQARFSPPKIDGIIPKVRAVIVYRFPRPSKAPPGNSLNQTPR